MTIYQTIAELQKKGEAVVLCTIVDSKGSTPRHEGSKMLVYPDGHIEGTVGGGEVENRVIAEAKDALEKRQTKVLHYSLVDPGKGDPGICGGQVEVYVEPIIPKLTILVIGAGHVGRQVVHIAKYLDCRVVVSDDRAELCTEEFMPGADEFLICKMSEIPQKVNINQFTYVVVTTRGADVDIEGLPAIMDSKAGYIGVIGSKRRWQHTQVEINKKKDYSKQFSSIYAPIGLELKAETPEEIAISIMAEILKVANRASGLSMKVKQG